MRSARRHVDVPAATFGVQARRDGDRFDERGLAAAVVTDEERDRWVQRQLGERADRGDREGIARCVRAILALEHDRAHEWVGHSMSIGVSWTWSEPRYDSPPHGVRIHAQARRV